MLEVMTNGGHGQWNSEIIVCYANTLLILRRPATGIAGSISTILLIKINY